MDVDLDEKNLYNSDMKKAVKLYLLEGTKFKVLFEDGITKKYDILDLAKKYPVLNVLKDRDLFEKGHLENWGGVVWNDELDIDAQTIYEEGVEEESEENSWQIIEEFKKKQDRLVEQASTSKIPNSEKRVSRKIWACLVLLAVVWGMLAGNTLGLYIYVKMHPVMFAINSAPWWVGVLPQACLTLLVSIFALLFILVERLKSNKKR